MPLEQFLHRRRIRRIVVTIGLILVVSALILADRNGLLLYRGTDYDRYHEKTFAVARIVDGDTLHIQTPDGHKRTTVVRLWGVDTPEIAKRNNGQLVRPAEPFADQARQFTVDLCQGKQVRVYLEKHNQRGKYGRLLAHVRLPDKTWLNERLLEAGLASADRRFSHSRYDHYQQLQREAKQAKQGMWR